MMLGASVFMINPAHKSFHRSVYHYWTSLDAITDIFILFLYTMTEVTSNYIQLKKYNKKI